MEQVHIRIYALVYDICGSQLGRLLCQNYHVDDLATFLITYYKHITNDWLSKIDVDKLFMPNESDDLDKMTLTFTEYDVVENSIDTSLLYDSSMNSSVSGDYISNTTSKKRKMYSCRACDKTYCSTDGVRKHWRKNHYDISITRGNIQDYCNII